MKQIRRRRIWQTLYTHLYNYIYSNVNKVVSQRRRTVNTPSLFRKTLNPTVNFWMKMVPTAISAPYFC